MKPKLSLREKDYFNENDTYYFIGLIPFISKVKFSNGYWWTTYDKYPQRKATTMPCVKIKQNEKKNN